ncbi:hypothetical protein [Peribacillus simplex]|uniref:hypothetical protein n=1 Tax=Peribacillus simplex TaxID=1478 RepID=UPI0011AACCE6|nr:hypothetical protein [Peribacillus simplex]
MKYIVLIKKNKWKKTFICANDSESLTFKISPLWLKKMINKGGVEMGLLGRVVFLKRLREELLEKRKQGATELQIDEIDKRIRKINLEIQNMKKMME